jgi:hypothetical protein
MLRVKSDMAAGMILDNICPTIQTTLLITEPFVMFVITLALHIFRKRVLGRVL